MFFIRPAFAAIMFLTTPAFAEGAAATQNPIMQIVPFILIFVVMYFLMIRPQSKKMKEHQALVNSLKPGAKVVTSGGIIGTISKVDADEFVTEIADGVHVRIVKSAVSAVPTKSASAKPSEPVAKKSPKKKES